MIADNPIIVQILFVCTFPSRPDFRIKPMWYSADSIEKMFRSEKG